VGDLAESSERDRGKHRCEERYEIANLNREGIGSSVRNATIRDSDFKNSALNDEKICTHMGTVYPLLATNRNSSKSRRYR
jgi:hypothetical protein